MGITKKILPTFLAGAIVISPLANSVEQSKTLWRQAPSLPYKVQEIYPTVYQNHVVVAGGLYLDEERNRIDVSKRVVFYDLESKTWRDGPLLPEPRHHPMLAVVDGRLLSFGGFTMDAAGVWHNSVDVLELMAGENASVGEVISKGQWQKIAEMPAPLAETLSAVHNGIVHLVSGRTPVKAEKNSQWNHQSDVDTHYMFDPKTLKWSIAAKVPTARNSACSVQTDEKLYTLAGRTVAGGNLANHEAYDFKSGKWQTLAPLPQAQGGLACAIKGEHIYVFGGEFFDNGGGVYSEVWQYSIAEDSWQQVSSMPNPRHGLGALNINDEIYVIAGASEAGGNKTSNAMSVFMP